jgi:hypothetical protein
MKRVYIPANNVHLSEEQLAYAIKAVERMAPLAHRPEATLQGEVLAELRRAYDLIQMIK